MWFKYGLKAQKLLAQGIALGIMAISNAPCKGKSFKIHRIKMETPLRYVKLLPLQGVRFATHKKPRALPWAKSFCPFRACCLYELLGRAAYMSFLALMACCLYGLLAFRACCLYELLGPFRACGIYLRNLLDHDLIRLAASLHDVQTLLQTMGATTTCIVVFCVGITADGVEVVNGSAAIVLSDAQFSS